MSSENSLQPAVLDLLTRLQSDAIERFEVEFKELRTTMIAMAASCGQSLTRLRDGRWISLDDASRIVSDWCEAAEAERSRATQLATDLEAARQELDEVRASSRSEIDAAKQEIDEVRMQCEVEIGICREAANCDRDESAAAYARELNAARARGAAAMDSEAKLREQLTTLQARNQEIVDAQMLRLVELQRELERTSAEAERLHKAERSVPEPSVGAQSLPRPVEAKRNHLTPEFHTLDAAVAGSPPVPAWERIA